MKRRAPGPMASGKRKAFKWTGSRRRPPVSRPVGVHTALGKQGNAKRDEQDADELAEEEEEAMLVSDTYAGALLLFQKYQERAAHARIVEERKQALSYPSSSSSSSSVLPKNIPKAAERPDISVVFNHHLYSVVKNRSVVDRELQACVQNHQLRLFDVSSGPSEQAVILESSYRQLVDKIALQASNPEDREIIERFATNVLPRCTDLSISVDDLCQLLYPSNGNDSDEERASKLKVVKRKPQIVLSHVGLLIRRVDIISANSYWFTMPRLGQIVILIKDSRKLLVSTIARRHKQEILKVDLLKSISSVKQKRKRSGSREPNISTLFGSQKSDFDLISSCKKLSVATSFFGIEYHVMDAVESGALRSIPTGMGPLLKLPVQKGII